MFDSLSGKLQNAFRNLRGLGKISEANVADTLREVRMALLEADVNFKVARDFIERVKTKAIGVEVVQSVQPGQQIIKTLHDELVDLLGSTNAGLNLSGNPSGILMVGLHGSGKTTSSGKLARLLQKQGRQPLLVAADVNRPAAMDQLETLGKQLELPVFIKRGETDVLKIAREALDFARTNSRNVLIFDTAGRLQIDEPLVQELVRLRDLVKPQEILLVLDAATGQEAVNVATHFDQALQITGSSICVQPSGGVENQNVAVFGPGEIQSFTGNFKTCDFAPRLMNTGSSSCLPTVSMAAGQRPRRRAAAGVPVFWSSRASLHSTSFCLNRANLASGVPLGLPLNSTRRWSSRQFSEFHRVGRDLDDLLAGWTLWTTARWP